jgi:preprotein translocase subunit SecA
LFNVTVEAVPAAQVAPVAEPEGLKEFATAAAAGADQRVEAGLGGRHAASNTLRAKGIDNDSPALTYSGPAEDGSAQVQRNGGDGHKAAAGVQAGTTRRERREAARRQGRGAKAPKSVKRR